MTAWIATSTYIVAMYMQLANGEVVKAVGEVDPDSAYITSFLLPDGEKCSGEITPAGNVVCTINNRKIYYFAIKTRADNAAVLIDRTASTGSNEARRKLYRKVNF